MRTEPFRDAIAESSAAALKVGSGLERMAWKWGRSSPPRAAGALRVPSVAAPTERSPQLSLTDAGFVIDGCSDGQLRRPDRAGQMSNANGSYLATTEVFGPVLGLTPVKHPRRGDRSHRRQSVTAMRPRSFTSSGASARKFRSEVPTGNVGVNIGVAALRWLTSRSAAGRTAFSGCSTGRAEMRSSSIPTRRSWSNAGRRNGRGASRPVSSLLPARAEIESASQAGPPFEGYGRMADGGFSQYCSWQAVAGVHTRSPPDIEDPFRRRGYQPASITCV